MPYLGYSRYPAKVRTRSIIRLVSSAFCCPSGRARRRCSSSASFSHACCRPCSKRRLPAPGSWLRMLPRIVDTSMAGRSLQRGLVMSISPGQRMPYSSRKARMASRAAGPPATVASSSRKPSSARPASSTCCRNSTTSGFGRITSATSSSANPISDVTLCGTDCVSVSATFFSPSHSWRCSLSHQVASIPAMITWRLRGSNRTRRSSPMSPGMKSNSSGPDLVRDVALQRGEGRPAALDELDDERRVGLDRSLLGARRRTGGSLVRERREEVAAVDDGLQRVPDQRIGPREVQHPRATRR